MVPALVLALVSGSRAWSAIAGLPDAPTPRQLPSFWVSLNDDLFGDAIVDNDDYRTGSVSVGAAYDKFVIAADYSAMTKRRDVTYTNGTRTDEVTVTAGLRVGEYFPDWLRSRSEVIVGGGVRLNGNLRGERTQNAIHGYFGFPQAALTYDQQQIETEGLGFVYGRFALLRIATKGHAQRTVELQAEGARAMTTGGERQSYAGLLMALNGRGGSAWLGQRYQWHEGSTASPTADIVAEHEQGLWLTAGLAKSDSLFLSAAYNWRTQAIVGSLGMALGSATPAIDQPAQTVDAVDGAIAPKLPNQTTESLLYSPGSAALGLQVRGPCFTDWCQPRHGRGLGVEWMATYQFGRVPGYADWQGNEVDADQLIGGLALPYTLTTPWRYGLQAQPYISGGVGVRVERVKVSDPVHRFDQSTATRGVAQGEAGIRSRLYAEEGGWYTRVWIGIGFAGWLPFSSQRITQGSDQDHYQRPGGMRQFSVGFVTDW